MRFEGRFDIFAIFMLLGISQGIFLTYYYLMKKNRQELSNVFKGLFILTCVIILSEILLNYSGLIVKVIWIENYSEPFVFLLIPLVFLIIKAKLGQGYTREDHVHFFPFVFYLIYCFTYFLQSPEFKFNSYVYCYQPDWQTIPVNIKIPEDPLGLRESLAPLYISQGIVYLYLIYLKLKYFPAEKKFRLFGKKDTFIRPLFTYWYHALIVTCLIIFVKIHFERDLGDYIIGSYFAILIYFAGFLALTRQFAHRSDNNEDTSIRPKYEKSSLTEDKKNEILSKITVLLEEKKYFTRNTISLSDTAKEINEPSHHVSQVINEKLNKNFFDLLSSYRIEEAKKLLRSATEMKYTIEEIAEKVGYNSKAAFNKAFKNITGQTPSEYRGN